MPPGTSRGHWFIFNTEDKTHLACPLTTWIFILSFKYCRCVPTPGPLHMPCGFCLPRFDLAASWLLRVQFTAPLPQRALPLYPHFHILPSPSPLVAHTPAPYTVCLGNDNVLFSLTCFRVLEEYSHTSVFMGDWFWDPSDIQIPDG